MNPPGTQAVRPLTVLSEEETLFRTVVHDYAATTIAPLVSRMDEEAQYDPALIPGLFDLGVMGVEIPEQYGGPGSSFYRLSRCGRNLAGGCGSRGLGGRAQYPGDQCLAALGYASAIRRLLPEAGAAYCRGVCPLGSRLRQ